MKPSDKEMASARRMPRLIFGGGEAYDGFSLCHYWFLLDEKEEISKEPI